MWEQRFDTLKFPLQASSGMTWPGWEYHLVIWGSSWFVSVPMRMLLRWFYLCNVFKPSPAGYPLMLRESIRTSFISDFVNHKMIICQSEDDYLSKERMIWTCKCRPRSNWGSLPRCQPAQARHQHLLHQHHLQPLPRANLEAPSAASAPPPISAPPPPSAPPPTPPQGQPGKPGQNRGPVRAPA